MRKGRCVSYIYRYRDNLRCENAGFIKIQCVSNGAENQARIQIGLRLYKKDECRCMVYLIHNNVGKYLTDISFCARERDTIMKRIFIPWDAPFDDGISLDKYDGIFFQCDDGEQLLGVWDDKDIDLNNLIISRREDITKKEDSQAEEESQAIIFRADESLRKDIEHKTGKKVDDIPTIKGYDDEMSNDTDTNITDEKSYQDICEEILETYPKLALFPDSQITECVKIEPQDIGKLHISNWKLGANSFLSHGFYQYRYIMFGKVRLNNNEEKVVIGVPGVFNNKEKYLANMFGFSVFVPVKKAKYLTGNFGYWISEVLRA